MMKLIISFLTVLQISGMASALPQQNGASLSPAGQPEKRQIRLSEFPTSIDIKIKLTSLKEENSNLKKFQDNEKIIRTPLRQL